MSCYLEVNGYIERVVTLQERTRVRQHPVSGTSEEPLGERNGGHRPRGESFTRDAAPPAQGGGRGAAVTWPPPPPQPRSFCYHASR